MLDLGPLYHSFFASRLTLYLSNGVNQMINMCLSRKRVLVESDCDRTVIAALQMAGAEIFFVERETEREFGMKVAVRADAVRQILHKYPQIDVVFISSPT